MAGPRPPASRSRRRPWSTCAEPVPARGRPARAARLRGRVRRRGQLVRALRALAAPGGADARPAHPHIRGDAAFLLLPRRRADRGDGGEAALRAARAPPGLAAQPRRPRGTAQPVRELPRLPPPVPRRTIRGLARVAGGAQQVHPGMGRAAAQLPAAGAAAARVRSTLGPLPDRLPQARPARHAARLLRRPPPARPRLRRCRGAAGVSRGRGVRRSRGRTRRQHGLQRVQAAPVRAGGVPHHRAGRQCAPAVAVLGRHGRDLSPRRAGVAALLRARAFRLRGQPRAALADLPRRRRPGARAAAVPRGGSIRRLRIASAVARGDAARAVAGRLSGRGRDGSRGRNRSAPRAGRRYAARRRRRTSRCACRSR